LNQQDAAISNTNFKSNSMEYLSGIELRLAKLEKHLPEMMMEKDVGSRLLNVEKYVESVNAEAVRFDKRMKQHASDLETVQASLKDAPSEERHRHHTSLLEEKADHLFTEALLLNEKNQEHIAAVDERLRTLEHSSESNMSVMHWENVHLLCDNVQVQQQQQMDLISSLRQEWAQQVQLIDTLQSEKSSVEDRLKALEEMRIFELIGNLNDQQDQQTTVIHGLQSEIQGLLREYPAGVPSQRMSSYSEPPSPDRLQSPSPLSSQTPPRTEYRSCMDINGARLHEQMPTQPLVSRPCIINVPLPYSRDVQQEPPDSAIDSGDLHPALQMELSKFPLFQTVAWAQNNLVRLPQLR